MYKGYTQKYMQDMDAVSALRTLITYAELGRLRPTDCINKKELEQLKDRILRNYNN